MEAAPSNKRKLGMYVEVRKFHVKNVLIEYDNVVIYSDSRLTVYRFFLKLKTLIDPLL